MLLTALHSSNHLSIRDIQVDHLLGNGHEKKTVGDIKKGRTEFQVAERASAIVTKFPRFVEVL